MNEFYHYSSKAVASAIICFTLFLSNSINAQTYQALATCDGISADSSYTYNITVSGLTPLTENYIFRVDGIPVSFDGILPPGPAPVPTAEIVIPINQDYINGLNTITVQVENVTTPNIEDIIVHEALCVDADNDGDLDFNEASCDYTQSGPNWGTIVATVAPYNGDNVYLYFLTDSTGEIGASVHTSTTGHFTGLENGDYKVYAYTFLTYGDALSFVDSLDTGDDLDDWTAGSDPICYNFCGDMDYTIDCMCPINIDTEPAPLALCEGFSDTMFIATSLNYGSPVDAFPEPYSLTYQWQSKPLGGSFGVMSGETDSTLILSDVTFAEDSTEYRVIVSLTVDGTPVCSDTSAAALLEDDSYCWKSWLSVRCHRPAVERVHLCGKDWARHQVLMEPFSRVASVDAFAFGGGVSLAGKAENERTRNTKK